MFYTSGYLFIFVTFYRDFLLFLLVLFLFCSCCDDPPIGFPLKHVRPRMCTTVKVSDIKVGDMVLVNYNIESPDERGFW